LRQYDFLVLFPSNPLLLARDREAFTPSRAKDEPSAAALQLELLLPHPDVPLFQALPGAGPVFASRLLVAFGEPRARYTSTTALQK
jgi:hypothetical protein